MSHLLRWNVRYIDFFPENWYEKPAIRNLKNMSDDAHDMKSLMGLQPKMWKKVGPPTSKIMFSVLSAYMEPYSMRCRFTFHDGLAHHTTEFLNKLFEAQPICEYRFDLSKVRQMIDSLLPIRSPNGDLLEILASVHRRKNSPAEHHPIQQLLAYYSGDLFFSNPTASANDKRTAERHAGEAICLWV